MQPTINEAKMAHIQVNTYVRLFAGNILERRILTNRDEL